MMESYKVGERILEDIEAAKVFGIVIHNFAEMFKETGLLTASEKNFRRNGMKKFQFTNDHLIEIFKMFTAPHLVENLRRLSKHTLEM
jgi:hypothetical protein